jgi:ribose transport system substrate-binding protein
MNTRRKHGGRPRSGLTGTVLVAAGLASASCGGAAQRDGDGLTVAVIPKGTTHEFWKSVHAGAVKAQRELAAQGIELELIWKGPLREDDREQQIQVVENFIGRRVDGIVLCPLDADALVAPAEAAAEAGIPVVIADSDLNSPRRVSFVATDNYQGGVLAAERLGQLLDGHGKAILLRYQPGSASTTARETGFLDTMRDRFPGVEMISSEQYAGATRETAYQAAQNLLNRFGREVDGVFTPNESSSVGMLLALRDLGRAGGDVAFVGFDASTSLVEALQAGDIQGLVVQNPLEMGYRSVLTLVAHIRGDSVPGRIDSGVALVTPERMQEPEFQALLHPPVSDYLNQ